MIKLGLSWDLFRKFLAMLNRFGFASHVQAAASTFSHALNVNVARFKSAAVNAVRFAMLNPFKDDHAGPAMHVLRSAMLKLGLSWDLIRKFFAMLNRFNEAHRVYVALPLHVYVARLLFVLVCHLVGFALRVYAGHALPSIVLGALRAGISWR